MNASELRDRLAKLGLRREDFDETMHRASGPGGQNVNKVSTAVTLVHRPSGTRVTLSDERFQGRNRALAWEKMLERLQGIRDAAKAKAKDERELLRRQKRPRPRKVKRQMLESKRHRAKIRGERNRRSDD